MTQQAIELDEILLRLYNCIGSGENTKIGIAVPPYEYRTVVSKLHRVIHGHQDNYTTLEPFTIDHHPFYVVWFGGHEITISRQSINNNATETSKGNSGQNN